MYLFLLLGLCECIDYAFLTGVPSEARAIVDLFKKLEKNVSTGHPLFEALHQELGIIVNAVNLEEYPIQKTG